MTWIESTLKALYDLKGQGTEDEILDTILKKGYRNFNNAKTPKRSLNMFLHQDKKLRGKVIKRDDYWILLNYQSVSTTNSNIEESIDKQIADYANTVNVKSNSTVISSKIDDNIDPNILIEEIGKIDDYFKNLTDIEKITISKYRIGHSKLRDMAINRFGDCLICGLSQPEFLIVSHIKPWSKSNNNEKLDVNNVLILCPQHDALFDKGYISFDEYGKLLISEELDVTTTQLMNITGIEEFDFNDEQHKYLAWHRKNLFE